MRVLVLRYRIGLVSHVFVDSAEPQNVVNKYYFMRDAFPENEPRLVDENIGSDIMAQPQLPAWRRVRHEGG